MAGVLALTTAFVGWVAVASAPNTLSASEKEAGWKLLFDGKSTEGWHLFKKDTMPANAWQVEGDWLHCLGKTRGDIVSVGLYDQFDLRWEWKIGPGGNGGLKYFVTDNRSSPLGHEYQMYDEPKGENPSGKPGKHSTASFYDVLAPTVNLQLKPVGEVNESRVVVKGNHVEHWLNGVKVLEYECGGETVLKAVAASKFKTTQGFGTRLKGHILLQDHGSEVWFRNVRILDLSSTSP